jgi:tRNA G46 methylase TrmB
MLESEETEYVIIVPDAEEYQIENLLMMNRDVNLKLVYFLDAEKIKQVFFFFFFYFVFLINF